MAQRLRDDEDFQRAVAIAVLCVVPVLFTVRLFMVAGPLIIGTYLGFSSALWFLPFLTFASRYIGRAVRWAWSNITTVIDDDA